MLAADSSRSWFGTVAERIRPLLSKLSPSIISAIPMAAAQSLPPVSSGDLIIGIIRVPGLDTPERLTGFMVALHKANADGILHDGSSGGGGGGTPARKFTAEVHYYPFCGSAVGLASGVCDFSDSAKAAGLAPFLGNMSRFHAIMFTQFDISAPIIDKAIALGGIPIIDPNTIRESDYSKPNLFLIDHHIETELTVLVRYMLMSHSCARTGIITEAAQLHYAELVRDSFTKGGYRTPPVLVTPAPTAEISAMFFDDPYQKCIVFLLTSGAYMALMGAVKDDPRFVPGDIKMFGWSQISTTNMRVDGTSEPFKHLYYPKALPSLTDTDTELVQQYNTAAAAWFAAGANTTDVLAHYQPGELALSAATTSGLMWYFRAMYGLRIVAHGHNALASGQYSTADAQRITDIATNAATANGAEAADLEIVALWQLSIDAARENKVWVGDYAFFNPFGQCPQKPLPQVCFCNIVTRVVNLRSINPTNGGAIPLIEKPLLGDVNIAAMPLAAEKCIHKLSVGSYPFRIMAVNDIGVSRDDDDAKTVGKNAVERFLYAVTAYQNNNDPIRPWRLITQSFSASFTADNDIPRANSELDSLNKVYKPFIVIGTARTVTKSDSLAMFTQTQTYLEDPPLTSRANGWSEKVLHFMPVMADLIHALVGYYSNSVHHAASAVPFATKYGPFKTHLFVIASSDAEAALVLKSLHSFQIDYDARTFVVSSDKDDWRRLLTLWAGAVGTAEDRASAGARPKGFVIAAAAALERGSISTSTELVETVLDVVESLGTIHVGISAPEPVISAVIRQRMAANSAYAIPAGGDVIYATPFSEHWLLSSPINTFIHDTLGIDVRNISNERPHGMNYLAIGAGLALTLGSQGVNFGDAAELLYTARTASVADVPLGLFYNDTCDSETISKNKVARTCQCSKAFRQFRLHSTFHRARGEPSDRTAHYVYRMATCGVLYEPLVIIPEDLSWRTYLIIGLVCGLALLLFVVVGTGVYCNSGRNNSNAPKDNTKPFTIVFTDIQASTTLWSRCPSLMSDAVDHHCVLIRKLIKKYNGYEVKTIGDSFMVAFASVEDATAFAIKLQQVLHEDDAWHSELDQHYKEILEAALIEQMQLQAFSTFEEPMMDDERRSRQSQQSGAGGNNNNNNNTSNTNNYFGGGGMNSQPQQMTCPPNAPADEEEYNRLWHGIRVRVGVHFGYGEIRKDAVTLGYDYFGTIVNTAARVEGVGHGGQTLATEAVLNELPRDFLTQQNAVQMSLGPQNLRGLDEKTVLVQLLPFTLADRKFPNLRLDVENVVEDGSESGTASAQDALNLTPEQMAVRLVSEVVNKGRKARGLATTSSHASSVAGGYTHNMVSLGTVGGGGVGGGNNANASDPAAVAAAMQQQQQQQFLKAQTASVAHIQELIFAAQQAQQQQLGSKTSNGGETCNASEHTLPPPPPSFHTAGGGVTDVTSGNGGFTVPQNLIITSATDNNFLLDAAGGGGGPGGYGSAAQPLGNPNNNNNMNNNASFMQQSGIGIAMTPLQYQAYRQHQSDIDSVKELLNYFHFFNALLSTSAENFRRDTVKQIAKRWHVPTSGGSVGHSPSDPTRMRIMMNLSVKSMMMVRTQNKIKRSNSRTNLSAHNNRSLSADASGGGVVGAGRRSQGVSGGGERSQAAGVGIVSGVNGMFEPAGAHNSSGVAGPGGVFANPRMLSLSLNNNNNNNNGGYIYRGGDGVDLHSPTISSRRHNGGAAANGQPQPNFFTATTAVSALSMSENPNPSAAATAASFNNAAAASVSFNNAASSPISKQSYAVGFSAGASANYNAEQRASLALGGVGGGVGVGGPLDYGAGASSSFGRRNSNSVGGENSRSRSRSFGGGAGHPQFVGVSGGGVPANQQSSQQIVSIVGTPWRAQGSNAAATPSTSLGQAPQVNSNSAISGVVPPPGTMPSEYNA